MNSNYVKNLIAKEINDNVLTTEKFIEAAQVYKKPAYPYATFSIQTAYIGEIGFDRKTSKKITSEDPNWDWDIENAKMEDASLVMTIAAYSLQDDEASELIHKLSNFFNFLGDEFFKNNGISVISVENITKIDFLIIDNYERRYTFDVKIRYPREIKYVVETIETIQI